jgi:hypothetical protein
LIRELWVKELSPQISKRTGPRPRPPHPFDT